MKQYSSLIEQKPDYLVCTCWGVMYSEIIDAIKAGHRSFESLQERLMVGTGCSSCVEEVMQILQETLMKKDEHFI